jgi:hypothetical protein
MEYNTPTLKERNLMAMNWNDLARIFPLLPPHVAENGLYNLARNHSEDYTGGQWTVENIGGFDFVIAPEGLYNVVNDNNYYEGTMNHRTFGVALTLLLYNVSLWKYVEKCTEELSERFYAMREAAYNDRSLNVEALYSFLD